MAQKTFKIGLSDTDKQNMAQDVYERLINMCFDTYNSANTYNEGDFVVYENPSDTFKLYKCLEDNVTGAWDSTKWQLATFQDLVDDIEGAVAFVNDKANTDGNYPTMTVGFADNLTPYDDESGDDQDEPFSFQATGTGNGSQADFATGSAALLKEKQGNTVVVNQLAKELNSTNWSLNNMSSGSAISGGVATFTATRQYSSLTSSQKSLINGHKYWFGLEIKPTTNLTAGQFSFVTNTGNTEIGIVSKTATAGQWNVLSVIAELTLTPTQNNTLYFYDNRSSSWDEIQIKEPLVIDLTQWFGSNDNIPAHLLDHPEHFFRYYQGSLAYNEGTLVNSNGRYIKCIGRQQWDEQWEQGSISEGTGDNVSSSINIRSKNYIRVNPNSEYYFKAPNYSTVYFYDANKNYIEYISWGYNQHKVIPSNVCYMRFVMSDSYGTTYNHDITISIYYEGESGYDQYYPYEVLSNIDTGTEVLRSAGNVKDYKTPDGTIHRLVGNRAYQSGDENDSSLTTDRTTTNYPLVTPTTEQGTSFSANLSIDDFGTMDFQGTNGVPQGNLIFYPVDYKAFIDTLYDYTEGTPSNIALKSDLSASESARDSVDTQLLNAVGGTLRQLLAVKETLDFDNTAFVDLGSLTWYYDENNVFYSLSISSLVTTNPKGICSKYTKSAYNWAEQEDKTFSLPTGGGNTYIIIKDTDYTDAVTFKTAMKGVLLAYEKA